MSTSNFSSLARRTATSVVALVATAGIAAAQQANASAAATGLGGNYIAIARGSDAVAWNPANLGLPGTKGFTLNLLSGGGFSGLDPVDVKDFNAFAGKSIPAATREQWVKDVTASNGESGSGDFGVSLLGLSFGALGLQLSTSGYGNANMSPDAFEVMMFGNAGRTGTVKPTVSLAGSNAQAGVFSTAAVSYGMSFGSKAGATSHSSFGATAKYVLGHAVMIAQDNGSSATPSNIKVVFPTISSSFDEAANAGSGIGLDLGYVYQASKMTFGATVRNAVNSFKWDESKMEYRPGTVNFDGTTNTADFDTAPYASAPALLKTKLANNKFKPVLAAGVAYEWMASTTISADVAQQLGDDDAINIGPKTRAGVGVEWRGIPMLPLRVGAAYITSGFAVSGGVGLRFGKFEMGFGGMMRDSDDGKELGGTISLISIR